MAINLTAWANMTGPECMFTAPNLITNNIWGIIIFGVTWVVLLAVLLAGSRDEKASFTASSGIMTIVAILMAIVSCNGTAMLSPEITIIPLVATVIGVMVMNRNTGGA